MAGRKTKRGTSGNAVQYVTRNQALKKLQLHLGEFRRLCILKGIHPREPNKKTQGQNKTYYHVKDLSFLAHEPLVAKLREQHAYEKKVRKARAKRNADLAAALASRRPTYTLDRLVKERYPSFMDALRDLDDPLTLCHLFSVLPAEGAHGIPAAQVAMSRRVALEWQAYVVRSHSLRKIFIAVKGFFFQADIMGQSVTWLVPHQLPQVLPLDVDYRVMLTFLEFYHTLLRFVHFRLYRDLGATYPPRVDEKLEAAAAGITALMTDLASTSGTAAAAATQQLQAGEAGTKPRLKAPQPIAAQAAAAVSEHDGSGSEDGDDVLSIDSGNGSEDDEDEGASTSDGEDTIEKGGGGQHQTNTLSPGNSDDAAAADEVASPEDMSAAGGALTSSPDDDAAICATLFRGLVFFLGREVPREVLLMVIRSFGGVAAWDGEGSPYSEAHECITHQVVDRPTQGHKFLSRSYVQPQWLIDAANFRVLPDVGKYYPGRTPPPHLSPFAAAEADGEEDHLPDYQLELQRLQEAAKAARIRAQNGPNATFLLEQEAEADVKQRSASVDGAAAAPSDAATSSEAAYLADLRAEMEAAGEATEAAAAVTHHPIETPTEEDALVADMLLPRKKRKLYASAVKAQAEKRSRTATLRERAAKAASAAAAAES